MPDDLDALRVRFSSILCSAPCQKIDFWLGGLHVSGAGFAVIAHALQRGGRGERGIDVVVEPLEKGAAAYHPARDAIVVPKREWAKEDAFERLAVVHEATHAWRDAQGARLTHEGRTYRPRAATDEAAAYVAGCLFDIYVQGATGVAASASPPWLAERKAPVHAVAYEVAMRQARKPPGSAVDRRDLSVLFASVTASAHRFGGGIDRYFEYDGIPR